MREYLDEAIVLDKEPNGDLDVRYALFMKRFGKLTAKAKSARKITSKLAPHLEPGNVAQVRLVEKNGLQVVDALKSEAVAVPRSALHFLRQLLPEGEPEQALWRAVRSGSFSWHAALAALGWDPQAALCARCGGAPEIFEIRGQEFFCHTCGADIPAHRAIPVRNASQFGQNGI